ncbi:hypothetical protein [Paraburkholderia bannensis]|uniref:hypothetical protein n=1 Tax=Paraburkholderia bannensis TaxID=765414 RepID=UPI002ABD8458|nr:hypothetical protein [Paraburkholderia bannensis]
MHQTQVGAITLRFDTNKIRAEIWNGSRSKNKDLSSYVGLGEQAEPLLVAICRRLSGLRLQSQLNVLTTASALGDAFAALGYSALPDSAEDWQIFVVDAYRFCLTRPDRTSKLRTRLEEWGRYWLPLLANLQQTTEIVPASVILPKPPLNFLPRRWNEADKVPLDGKAQDEDDNESLIIGISLARTDAAYLDEVEAELSRRRTTLHRIFSAHWQMVVEHFDYGQNLLSRTSPSTIDRLIDESNSKPTKLWCHLADHPTGGFSERSFADLLAVIIYRHDGWAERKCFITDDLLQRSGLVAFPPGAPEVRASHIHRFRRLNWMLGNLTMLDLAIAAALLVMAQPSFTPYALADANIHTKSGADYLTLEDSGLTFRVPKFRSVSFKTEQLEEESGHIIRDLIRISARARKSLEKTNPADSDKLFVYVHKGEPKLPSAGQLTCKLTGRILRKNDSFNSTILLEHPELIEAKIDPRIASLSNLRNTEGVLEWFRTGSLFAMSRKLGNQKKTTLHHYIPKALMVAWNERLVRRFQNLLLVVASSGEPYALSACDFNSVEELHEFIMEMLQRHPSHTSPLAKLLHKRYVAEDTARPISASDSLAVPIAPDTVTVLYAYRELALRAELSDAELRIADEQTGISPRQFIDLADLLKRTLPEAREPEFRAAHQEAEAGYPLLCESLNWHDLIAGERRMRDGS